MTKLLLSAALLSCSLSVIANDNDCFERWETIFDNENIKLEYVDYLGICDFDLRGKLHEIAKRGHSSKSYSKAVKHMYKKLDKEDGKLCSVYTPDECNLDGQAKEYRINCEHTWPKSKGAKEYPMVSDLHHLYPSEKDINNLRANHPFCEVSYTSQERGGSKYGVGNGSITCFEPQDEHKGNVARSMFYFAVRYGQFIDSDQEAILRKWNKEDPVNKDDILRNKMIKEFQGNTNPFIEQNYLIDLIDNF